MIVLAGLSLTLLIGMGGISLYAIRLLVDSMQRVSHTHEVLAQLERVIGDLAETESQQRAYLLSGIPERREAFLAAERTVWPDFERLRVLTVDNQAQVASDSRSWARSPR